MRLQMRVIKTLSIGIVLSVTAGLMLWCAAPAADFSVTGIVVHGGFVTIELVNKSNNDVPVSTGLKEKVFLIVYINNLKRAEYKIKYLDPKLFKKRGKIVLRTNFRAHKPVNVRVEVNPLKVIPETNFSDNRLTKTVSAGSK